MVIIFLLLEKDEPNVIVESRQKLSDLCRSRDFLGSPQNKRNQRKLSDSHLNIFIPS